MQRVLNGLLCYLQEDSFKAKSDGAPSIHLNEAMKPGSGSGSGTALRITRCEKHPHQEINTYCHTDKLAICAECAIDHHKGHEVDRLTSVVQGFREEILQLVDKVCSSFVFKI